MNKIEVRNSLLFCQELPEHLFLLVGIILSWTSIWVFITPYRGTLGKVVKITCSQDDLRNSDSACVLQVSNAPPLAFHSPKCLLNDDSSPADVGVATKVCISKSPVVTPGGDDEGKILTDVCTIPQQTVLPILSCHSWKNQEDCSSRASCTLPGIPVKTLMNRPSASTIPWRRTE